MYSFGGAKLKEALAAPTLKVLPRGFKTIQPLHGKVESDVFVSSILFKSLTTNTQREITIFFPSVCFSKVSSESLPIWLRKTEAPVTNCVHNPLCGLETFPTYRCYKKWLMFFQGPTVCSSATDKGDRVMSEVLFVLWDDSGNKSFQRRRLGSLCFACPTPIPLTFRSSGRFPLTLTIPSLKSQTITRLFFFFFQSFNCTQFTLGTCLKGKGFET